MALCRNLTITDISHSWFCNNGTCELLNSPGGYPTESACYNAGCVTCQPPGGVQRKCQSDNKTICVWNVQRCDYDCQMCSTGHCANGYCDAPPMYNACIGGYCNQQVCPESGCPANQCATIGAACGLNQISIPGSKSVIKNNSAIITATCKDTNGAGMTCPTLTWAKSNNNVDIVPWDNNIDCTIIGVNVGTCIVVASGGGKLSNNCTVTITESTGTLNQIIITSSISIVKGNTGSVSYSCKDTLGNNMTCPTLTWTSSNTSVATVSNGMITGVNAGTCVVKAAGGGKTSNDCNVTITSITPPPTNNYGCYNGQCLQGYGTLPPGCNNTCTTPTPTKYNCVSGQCQGPYTEGTFDSYADCVASGCGGVVNNYGCFGNQCLQGYGNLPPGCNNTCGGGEIDPCISCDKETQYCLFGQCVKKNDAYMAAGAVVLLMLLTKK